MCASSVAAADSVCDAANARASGAEDNFRPPLEATVASKDKVFLHSAPLEQCRTKTLVPAGASLTVYKPHKDWLEVMYIDKSGDDHTGWLQGKHVRVAGRYGGK